MSDCRLPEKIRCAGPPLRGGRSLVTYKDKFRPALNEPYSWPRRGHLEKKQKPLAEDKEEAYGRRPRCRRPDIPQRASVLRLSVDDLCPVLLHCSAFCWTGSTQRPSATSRRP